MRRRRTDLLVFLVAFLLCKGSCFAQENFLARFLPRKEAETQLPNLNLPALQAFSPAAVDSDRHNHGVSLNNEGLEYLKEGNFKKAIPLFSKACDEDPSEPAFLFNLALALKNSGHNSHEAIEAFKKLMVMSPKDYQPSYGIGEILFEQMKKTKESLPFFSHANKLKPEDPKVATTLALAYFRAGYDEQSLALLKQNAHLLQNDPYPFYLMGIIFLKQENYIPAVRALKSALDKDKEGFVHDAYIRARFFAGQLEGLAEECAGVLKRFPAIINKSILERIHFSLIPLDVSLTETITISIKDPTFISRMDVLVSLPPEMPSHQHVLLENSEWISGEKLLAVNPSSPEKDGKIRFSAPPQLFSPLIQLRLKYSIRTFPWLGSKGPFSPPPYPKIEEMKSDETFCLSNAKLHSLSLALDKLPGNALQNSFLAVGRGLVYKENYKDYTVEWALEHPDDCDCTEFSNLLAALCLKRGTPARVITGFLLKPETMNKETEIGHAWCEIYFRDKGWIPVDPTLGSTLHWAYFGNLLSDQILFSTQGSKKSRISIDFTSNNPNVGVSISCKYRFSLNSGK